MYTVGEGVCVQASTLGSLEALLELLRSDAVKIPVSGINIGPVHRRDIMRASVMLEKGRKKYACVLAFDVPVTKEARELADESGVKVFTADIIYHLFDQFTAYLKQVWPCCPPYSPGCCIMCLYIRALSLHEALAAALFHYKGRGCGSSSVWPYGSKPVK